MDFSVLTFTSADQPLAVIPVLVGPLQALIAVLPGILIALGGLIVTLFKPSTVKRLLLLLWAQKFIVLPVILVAALAVWGLIALSALVFPATAADIKAATGGSWPLWRGGPERRGAVLDAEDPAHGKVVWSFSHDGIKNFYCSPAAVGNRVYATSARWEVFKKDGAIYSLDADSGKLDWMFDSKGYRPTFSSPAVYHDKDKDKRYLVVGEGLHLTEDARVFCLDIDASEEKKEGVVLWSFRTKSHVESSPCIADGKVFIGAGGDGMYCFDLEQEDEEAEFKWHLPGDKYPDCETSPVYYRAEGEKTGKVYFGLGIGGQAVVCVDAETGEEQWRVDTPYPVFGSPSISGGKLYVGMGHGDFINTAEQVATNLGKKLAAEGKSKEEIAREVGKIRPVGEVWCIDLAGRKVDWKFPVGRVVLGAVAVDGKRIYFGSRDEHLYSVSTDGKTSRKWNAHASIVTSPAVAEKHVYVVTETGQLYGLDKKKMSLVWNVSLNVPSFSSPSVARGHVYVGSTGNGLMCVGRPGREKVKPIWPGALGGAGKAGWVDDSMLPGRGAYSWGYVGEADDSGQKPAPPAIHAPAAYVDGTFYVVLNRKGAFGLARLDSEQKSNEEQSQEEQPRNRAGGKLTQRWLAPSKNAVYLSAAATEKAVFFVDGRIGDSDRLLRRLDVKTGKEIWTLPVAADAGGEFVITYDKLFISDTAKGLTCLEVAKPAAAKELWQANVGPVVGQPVVTENMVVVLVRSPGQLVVLDRASGVQFLAVPLKSAPRTGPVLMGNRVWFGAAEGVGCYDLARRRMAETIDTGPVATRLVSATDRLACVNEAGELVVIALEQMEEVFDAQEMPRERVDALVAGYDKAGWPAKVEEREEKAESKDERGESDDEKTEPQGKKLLVVVRPQWPSVRRVAGALTSLPPVLTDDAALFSAEGSLRHYDLRSQKDSQWALIRASFPGRLVSPMIVADSHVFFATDKKGLVCMKPKRR